MKAIFINSLGRGGAERVVSHLVRNIPAGDKLFLIAINDDVAYPIPKTLKYAVLAKMLPEFMPKILISIISPLLLAIFIHRNKVRYVQSHLFQANCINVLSKFFFTRHYASIVNTGAVSTKYNDGSLKSLAVKLLMKMTYPIANKVIYKSKAMQADFQTEIGRFRNEAVFYNPNDSALVKSSLSEEVVEIDWSENCFYISVVGRLIGSKRVEDIFYALNFIQKEDEAFFKKIRLLIIGDGAMRTDLENSCRVLGLEKMVHFLGYQTNPFKFIAKSNLYVSASESEGMPNSLVEAMLCETPIISADCFTGPREILSRQGFMPRDNFVEGEFEPVDFGCLFQVGDVKGLGHSILNAYQNRSGEKVRNAYHRAMQFDIEARKDYFLRDLNPKVAVFTNSSWNIFKFRQPLIQHLTERGFDLVTLTPEKEFLNESEIKALTLDLSRKGSNPLAEFRSVFQIIKASILYKIDFALPFSIKPNLYSCMAQIFLPRLNVICNISGLGTVFLKSGLKSSVAKFLYKVLLRKASYVFFQNTDDMELFFELKILSDRGRVGILPGSGIDLTLSENIQRDEQLNFDPGLSNFLFVGRFLKDKGLLELKNAVSALSKSGSSGFKLYLLGQIDLGNPSSLTEAELHDFEALENVINLGFRKDALNVMSAADCVVLPSYREGTPRTLLEAGLLKKPIIATEVAGNKDVVDHGVNGYLCPSHSFQGLSEVMRDFINLDKSKRESMGHMSYKKIVENYDVRIIQEKYLEVMQSLQIGGSELK